MHSVTDPELAADLVVQLHAEEVSVARRKVAGAVVRVATVTRERAFPVAVDLTHERVEVERVPIDRQVDAVPPVRQQGDTTIVSVVEETIVVERRLILKEEVHIRRVRVGESHRETMMVREQDAVITRTEAVLPATQDDRRILGNEPTKST